MALTHPYQGHLLQHAFEGFVSFASKHDDFRDKAVFQEFVNWCVGQFGSPDDLGLPD